MLFSGCRGDPSTVEEQRWPRVVGGKMGHHQPQVVGDIRWMVEEEEEAW